MYQAPSLTEAEVRRIAEEFHMKPRVGQITEPDVRRIVAEMILRHVYPGKICEMEALDKLARGES